MEAAIPKALGALLDVLVHVVNCHIGATDLLRAEWDWSQPARITRLKSFLAVCLSAIAFLYGDEADQVKAEFIAYIQAMNARHAETAGSKYPEISTLVDLLRDIRNGMQCCNSGSEWLRFKGEDGRNILYVPKQTLLDAVREYANLHGRGTKMYSDGCQHFINHIEESEDYLSGEGFKIETEPTTSNGTPLRRNNYRVLVVEAFEMEDADDGGDPGEVQESGKGAVPASASVGDFAEDEEDDW